MGKPTKLGSFIDWFFGQIFPAIVRDTLWWMICIAICGGLVAFMSWTADCPLVLNAIGTMSGAFLLLTVLAAVRSCWGVSRKQ